jgi:hypothetical protein
LYCSELNASASRPGFVTYHDKRYGFELSFPQVLKPTQVFVSHYHLAADHWRQGFFDNKKLGLHNTGVLAVAVVAYRPNGDKKYPDVEVRVGIRPGKTAEEACGSVPSDEVRQSEVELGGRKFQVSDISSGGMSQYIGGESFRTFSNGYCYAVERFVTDTSIFPESQEEDEAKAKKENDALEQAKKQADAVTNSHYEETKAIVESFRLLSE